jgi:hypothetical protein
MIRKRNIEEQWIVLTNRSTQAAIVEAATAIAEFNGRIANVYGFLRTAGITGAQVVDLNVNGTTVFGAGSVKISFATTVATATFDPVAEASLRVSKGDRISIDVDSVHSGTAAIGLTIFVQLLRRGKDATTFVAPSALK